LGFWLMGKMEAPVSIGYVIAQPIGACLGSLPLLAWGAMGRSVAFGATLPGAG
jgi:aquaporin Z